MSQTALLTFLQIEEEALREKKIAEYCLDRTEANVDSIEEVDKLTEGCNRKLEFARKGIFNYIVALNIEMGDKDDK